MVIQKIISSLFYPQDYEEETVEAVSAVCRTVSLAQLQNSMPKPRIWRGIGRIPHEPHYYVYEYIGMTFNIVFKALCVQVIGVFVLSKICLENCKNVVCREIRFLSLDF